MQFSDEVILLLLPTTNDNDDDDEVILLLPSYNLWNQVNPKRYGCLSWTRYEAYKHTQTFEHARAFGATTRDIKYAIDHSTTHLN